MLRYLQLIVKDDTIIYKLYTLEVPMDYFKKSKLFFWTVEIFLFILIFYLLYQVNFIFNPITTIFLTLFSPIVIALFLYYLCNPLVTRLVKLNIPKALSILIIFLSFIGLVVILVAGIIPEIVQQTTQLINGFPAMYESAYQHMKALFGSSFLENFNIQSYDQLEMSIISIVASTILSVFTGIGSFAGSVWSVTITIITVPIVLIYLFKDGHLFYENIIKTTPQKHRGFIEKIFTSIHSTLQAYITGQATVCLYVGVSLFVCYTVTGIPYAFLLAIFAGIMDIIPYVGPWIASVPAIIVAFSISPLTAVIIIIAIVLIQLGESYIVSPYIMGKSLHLHPIIVIFVLLIAGQLSGLVGMILGIPIFMMIKITLEETIAYVKKKKAPTDYLDEE